ncbi:MAG: ankyrin repeat domain-containing protein [Coxiellaceae bacterium]|nr:ankyrin repeat domain-containing protein [Coxiellaceae bacterium]
MTRASTFAVLSKEFYRAMNLANKTIDIIPKNKLVPGRNPFKNIKIQANGDLVGQLIGHYSGLDAERLVIMAAILAARSDFLKINNKPLIVPASVATVAPSYYQQAIDLVSIRVQQLESAYKFYFDQLKSSHSSKHSQASLHCLNKLTQVQQFLVGTRLLLKQYLLLQPGSNQRLVLNAEAEKKCMGACADLVARFNVVLLSHEASQAQLLSAANRGDIDQLIILLADPAVDVNQVDDEDHSALLMATKANQYEVVKLLVEHGAADPVDALPRKSALVLSAINGYHDITECLLKSVRTKHVINTKPLHQGPSNKNRALKDVEYIYFCMMRLPYHTAGASELDKRIYQAKTLEDGELFTINIEKNARGHFLVTCPNGQTYNLSLALKHANFDCYMLGDDDASKSIVRESERYAFHTEEDYLAQPWGVLAPSGIGQPPQPEQRHIATYRAEEVAIGIYTQQDYIKINEFLRALSNDIAVEKVKKILCISMLAISGVNKSIEVVDQDKVLPTLTRNVDSLPPAMLATMQSASGVVKKSGFGSFSRRSNGVFSDMPNKITVEQYNTHIDRGYDIYKVGATRNNFNLVQCAIRRKHPASEIAVLLANHYEVTKKDLSLSIAYGGGYSSTHRLLLQSIDVDKVDCNLLSRLLRFCRKVGQRNEVIDILLGKEFVFPKPEHITQAVWCDLSADERLASWRGVGVSPMFGGAGFFDAASSDQEPCYVYDEELGASVAATSHGPEFSL